MSAEPIQTVAVLGLGTMGHGIAQTFAVAGLRVQCFEEQPAVRDSFADRVRRNLADFAAVGAIESSAIPAVMDRLIVCSSEEEAVTNTQFVTEAVWEDLAVKQDLLARLEQWVSADAILASNSSAFPISQSGNKLRHPERALVTHWFNPPHLVPVVEVVPGPQTSEATTQNAVTILRRIGKQAVRLHRELPGFLVNRLQVALMREIWYLVDQGVASVEDIDAAVRGSVGFRLAIQGPLEVQDFGGLDIQARTFENLGPTLSTANEVPTAVRALLDRGHLGFKTGRGFHDYPPGVGEAKRARRDRLFLALHRLLEGSAGP